MSRALQILHGNPIIDGYRLGYLANRFLRPMYAELERDFGISRPEFLVLFCLANVPDLTAQEIADVTARPKNTISRAVGSLMRQNLIVRASDEGDGRKAPLALTRAGRKLYAGFLPRWIEHERRFLSPLDEDERRVFSASLRKLIGPFLDPEEPDADEGQKSPAST